MASLSVNSPARVLDLPASWLWHLIQQELGPKELVAMSQTCQTLQHEVLTGRDVTLTAHMHEPGAENRHISLQRACQLAASVHLKLAGSAPAGQPKQKDGVDGEQAQQPNPPVHTLLYDPVCTAQAHLVNAVIALGPTLVGKGLRALIKGVSLVACMAVPGCDEGPPVTDSMSAGQPRPMSDEPSASPHNPAHTAQAYLSNAVTALGTTRLNRVLQATLQGMYLNALVPSWLTDACPQLTSLCLEDVTLTLPAQPTNTGPSTTLKHLTLPAPPEFPEQHRTLTMAAAYRRQLLALRALRQLTVSTPLTVVLLTVMQPITTRLTALHLPQHRSDDGDQRAMVVMLLEDPWPALTELSLPLVVLHDRLMRMLLQGLPALTTLHCNRLDLEEDYNGQRCSLKQLVVNCLDVQALANLPLHSLESVTVRSRSRGGEEATLSSIVLSGASDVQNRVVQELQRMGGLRWEEDSDAGFLSIIMIFTGQPMGSLTAQHVQTAAVLLSTYTTACHKCALHLAKHLGVATLDSCGQLLQRLNRAQHRWVLFFVPESVDPEVWPQLLPATSNAYQLCFRCPELVLTEAVLSQIFSSVPSPVVVSMVVGAVHASEGWLRRVGTAAAAARNKAAESGGAQAILPPRYMPAGGPVALSLKALRTSSGLEDVRMEYEFE